MSDGQLRLDPIGLKLRRQVIGPFVDSAVAGADEFDGPLQEVITNHAWGGIWQRPGLSPAMRSMATVAMLTALNRPYELELHLAGALRNGCTPEEIRELLLHSSVYCGMPAAVDAFRIARRVLNEFEQVPATEP